MSSLLAGPLDKLGNITDRASDKLNVATDKFVAGLKQGLVVVGGLWAVSIISRQPTFVRAAEGACNRAAGTVSVALGRGPALPEVSAPLVAMIVGETGTGKSLLGNTLANRCAFDVCHGPNSVTRQNAHGDFLHNGRTWRVFDTAGFRDTEWSRAEHLAAFATRAPEGVSVFLFVLRYGRFTEDHARAFQQFRTAASEAALKHVLLVFTHARAVVPREASVKFAREARENEHLRQILDSLEFAQGRKPNWVCVDLDPEGICHESRARVLEAVEEFHQASGEARFSNEAFKQARRAVEALRDQARGLGEARLKTALEVVESVRGGDVCLEEAKAKIAELQEAQRRDLRLLLAKSAFAAFFAGGAALALRGQRLPEPPASVAAGAAAVAPAEPAVPVGAEVVSGAGAEPSACPEKAPEKPKAARWDPSRLAWRDPAPAAPPGEAVAGMGAESAKIPWKAAAAATGAVVGGAALLALLLQKR